MDYYAKLKRWLAQRFESKESAELKFQRQWKQFEWTDIQNKLKEYWTVYRHMQEIQTYIDLDETSNILDVGCGVISVLNLLPGNRYGIDPLIEKYKELYSLNETITWKKGYGEKIPFEDMFFDIVFCSNVIDHTEKPGVVISEIRRVLKKGGKLILTVDIFPVKKVRDAAHPYCMDNNDVDALLSHGWKILYSNMSPINAQVFNFVSQSLSESNYKERILVAEKL